MINNIRENIQIRMDKCLKGFKENISKIRSNRASPSLLDGIFIDYYGVKTSLQKVASIIVEDASTLKINLFDRALISVVEKAIISSDLGLNPISFGNDIRVPIPVLTKERRKNLIKIMREWAEQGRVSIRNMRRDANDKIKSLSKRKDINQDDEHRAQNEIQKITDLNIKKLDSILEKKEKEMMTL